METTREFRLIRLADIAAASYAAVVIDGSRLVHRILFARTQAGNFAKLQVHVESGGDLRIRSQTVYAPDGTIVRTDHDLIVPSSYSYSIDTATVGATPADFYWEGITATQHQLAPDRGAFFLMPGFDESSQADLGAAPYSVDAIDSSALTEQLIFCRTRHRWLAKLLIEVDSGGTLWVRRLTVYPQLKWWPRWWPRPQWWPQLRWWPWPQWWPQPQWWPWPQPVETADIAVQPTETLDLETVTVGDGVNFDLWWDAVTPAQLQLRPMNGAQLSFASYYRFQKYRTLLGDPAIHGAFYLDQPGGGSTPQYDYWPEWERLLLNEFLYTLELGEKLPLTGPPALSFAWWSDGTMGFNDAVKIYLAHAAQSLWTEATGAVPWSLSRDPLTLQYLLDSTKLFTRAATEYYFGSGTLGFVTDWNPQNSYAFLQDTGLIKSDQWGTIRALADWCRGNLQHIIYYASDPNGPFATQSDQYLYLYGYAGFPPVDKMCYPLPGRPHVTHGCHGTTGFFAAILRSVNVPVRHGWTTFTTGLHSRPEFFSVGQNFAHGDDPYDRRVGGQTPPRAGALMPPIAQVFVGDSMLRNEIDNPTPAPGQTVAQATDYNQDNHLWGLAVQYTTDYLLALRCHDLQSGTSRLQTNLQPFYTAAQLTQIEQNCDAAIAAAGGCSAIPPL